MQKFNLFILLFFVLANTRSFGQHINQTVIDPVRNRPVLIDLVDRDGMKTGEMGAHFEQDYQIYKPNADAINQLKKKLRRVKIVIVLASWCGDSKEQLPRFMKVLDQVEFKNKHLTIIAVDSHKKGREQDVQGLNIVKVPTFIFYRKGKEIGRIIETPVINLEEDFLAIIKK